MRILRASLLGLIAWQLQAADFAPRYAEIVRSATPRELYAFLNALPKGGDIHHHNGLSAPASVWYQMATSPQTLARNSFYTLSRPAACPGDPPLPPPRFLNIQKSRYDALDTCRKPQYEPLAGLTPALREEWISSLILDRPGEARDEFFERIVPRFGDLSHDPYLSADVIAANMKLFGAEGVRYIESQMGVGNYIDASGQALAPEATWRIIRDRLRQPDVAGSGVAIRFQGVVIRFTPNAEQSLEAMYAWIAGHREDWVGINMAGREDNDKGYALRFLATYRKMRRTYSDVPLSIHAGEKDSPGHQVRDTLLLGASRIGHGVNLITDPDTMLLMRNGKYLVEINLVSNKVLDYVPDTSTHPFPEYLRFGIPVCLNTDDRGSWDSNMTDEYYTAVTNFQLTWAEIVQLGRNSLSYSFAEPALKEKMLREYDRDLAAFAQKFDTAGWRETLKTVKPAVSGYAARTWNFHE
jgi:adenosine deaminase CECR1